MSSLLVASPLACLPCRTRPLWLLHFWLLALLLCCARTGERASRRISALIPGTRTPSRTTHLSAPLQCCSKRFRPPAFGCFFIDIPACMNEQEQGTGVIISSGELPPPPPPAPPFCPARVCGVWGRYPIFPCKAISPGTVGFSFGARGGAPGFSSQSGSPEAPRITSSYKSSS